MASDPRNTAPSGDMAAVCRLLQVHGVAGVLALLADACELEARDTVSRGPWLGFLRSAPSLVTPDRWQEFARCLRLYASTDGWRGPALVDVTTGAEVTTLERGTA